MEESTNATVHYTIGEVGNKSTKVYLLGTSHISQQAIEAIKKSMNVLQPTVVAVELDKHRAQALLQNVQRKIQLRDAIRLGLGGLLFYLFGHFGSRSLGKLAGVEPGEEMRQAMLLAGKAGIPVVPIDRPIAITVKRVGKAIGLGVLLKAFIDSFKPLSHWKQYEIPERIDLSKVPGPKVVKAMMKYLNERFPEIARPLILERDIFMSRNIKLLMKHYSGCTLLVVVGAGHVRGIKKRVSEATIIDPSSDL